MLTSLGGESSAVQPFAFHFACALRLCVCLFVCFCGWVSVGFGFVLVCLCASVLLCPCVSVSLCLCAFVARPACCIAFLNVAQFPRRPPRKNTSCVWLGFRLVVRSGCWLSTCAFLLVLVRGGCVCVCQSLSVWFRIWSCCVPHAGAATNSVHHLDDE